MWAALCFCLTSRFPVASVTREESISLPSTSSGVTRAAVQLPRQGVDIRLTGGLLAEKSGRRGK